jgi:hypothetical protein
LAIEKAMEQSVNGAMELSEHVVDFEKRITIKS